MCKASIRCYRPKIIAKNEEVMMIDRAILLAKRQWENLRFYFEMCGDIGDFDFDDLKNCRWFSEQECHEVFIANIFYMDKKLPQYEYATPEALNVFTVLASKAAEKLGLKEELALAFGMGYGFVQTGLFSYCRLEPKQILFHKMFYPLGLICSRDFDPSLVKKKLKIVYERFKSWQDNPQLYLQDLKQFQNIEEVWKEWENAN